ncbi:putative acylesterase/phospholipase RssA [Burkholderia sp. OAS925]|uniref:patatin-like phospholipase family protein n=1 Tax=Paraburkholderia sp. OAS925 TaxID=2663827 RepID=UPI0019F4CB43
MKLLAIDGGGIRGTYASHVLERIQREFNTVFHSEFDLIAGTSTGSIIAAAIAFGIPILKVTELYRKEGPSYLQTEEMDIRAALSRSRDIDQTLGSQDKIDTWFEAKTKSLNDWQKNEPKKQWGTMQSTCLVRARAWIGLSKTLFTTSAPSLEYAITRLDWISRQQRKLLAQERETAREYLGPGEPLCLGKALPVAYR